MGGQSQTAVDGRSAGRRGQALTPTSGTSWKTPACSHTEPSGGWSTTTAPHRSDCSLPRAGASEPRAPTRVSADPSSTRSLSMVLSASCE